MSKKKSLYTILVCSAFAISVTALADGKNEVSQLDSVSFDKAGDLHFTYTVNGSCEHHEAKVEAEVESVQNQTMMNTATTAKIKIYDVSEKSDSCSNSLRVEGKVSVTNIVQQAADAQGAMIEDRRIPISLPPVSTFTGK
jgi:hypothetical protein